MSEVDEKPDAVPGWKQLEKDLQGLTIDDTATKKTPISPADFPRPVIQRILYHFTQITHWLNQPRGPPPTLMLETLSGQNLQQDIETMREIERKHSEDIKAYNAILEMDARQSLIRVFDFGMVCKAFRYEVDQDKFKRIDYSYKNDSHAGERSALQKSALYRSLVRHVDFWPPETNHVRYDLFQSFNEPRKTTDQSEMVRQFCSEAMAVFATCPILESMSIVSKDFGDCAPCPPTVVHPPVLSVRALSIDFPYQGCIDMGSFPKLRTLSVFTGYRNVESIIFGGKYDMSLVEAITTMQSHLKPGHVVTAPQVTDLEFVLSVIGEAALSDDWGLLGMNHLVLPNLQRVVVSITDVQDSVGTDQKSKLPEIDNPKMNEQQVTLLLQMGILKEWLIKLNKLVDLEINVCITRDDNNHYTKTETGERVFHEVPIETKWGDPRSLPNGDLLTNFFKGVAAKCPNFSRVQLTVGIEVDSFDCSVVKGTEIGQRRWSEIFRRWEATVHPLADDEKRMVVEVDYTIQKM